MSSIVYPVEGREQNRTELTGGYQIIVEGKKERGAWLGHMALSDSAAFCHLPSGLSIAVMFNNAKDTTLLGRICHLICSNYDNIPMPLAPMHLEPTYQRRQVSLTLLDIFEDANDDIDVTRITQLATSVLANVHSARSILEEQPTVDSEEDAIASVLCFTTPQDKWTALASFLLKSDAFYTIHPNAIASRNPVVLPRTSLKKPFIPASHRMLLTNHKEEEAFPLSVSHHFPYVGRALVALDNVVHSSPQPQHYKLGMDIVVFRGYNESLYASEHDFLCAFRGHFTGREWSCIMQCPVNDRLKEFYVRWSLKEAYTKALGVGMHCEFKSFDIRLDPIGGGRNCDEGNDFIWKRVSSSDHQNGIYFTGLVNFLSEAKSNEQWEVVLYPIHSNADGIACVFIGPSTAIDFSSSAHRCEVDIKWSKISSFITP